MERFRLGIAGLGNRGQALLSEIADKITDQIEVTAVCDVYSDRVDAAREKVKNAYGKTPSCFSDYGDLLASGIDAVLISAGWEAHVPMATAAMRAGIYAATEVGGAYSVKDCFDLIAAHEESGTPCMMLENCCYGKRELMTLRMAREGLFGDVVHADGGYIHDLREEVGFGKESRHYRLRNYLDRNCENYPTHALGPIAKVLNINEGNSFVSLTSTASCSKGMNRYITEKKGPDDPLASAEFRQGDVVTTVIRCAGGETVTLTLMTTLPTAYSRNYTICGTRGSYHECGDYFYFDGEHNQFEWDVSRLFGNANDYENDWLHPIWKNHTAEGGHGGMDHLVLQAMAESVREGIRPPIDVYDAAAYMAVTALSSESVAGDGKVVYFPDFTNGRWKEKREKRGKYAL